MVFRKHTGREEKQILLQSDLDYEQKNLAFRDLVSEKIKPIRPMTDTVRLIIIIII